MEDAQPGGNWPAAWYRSKRCVNWSNAKSVGKGHSLCIEDEPEVKGEPGQWRSQPVKAAPGSSYTLSWSWHYNEARDIDAHIRFFDIAGKFIGQRTVAASGSNKGFEQQTQAAVAPPNASTVDVLFSRSANGSGSVWIDDVVFTDQQSK